jgi:nucleotidyltransferase/DNA polymerase involved in DNA repair
MFFAAVEIIKDPSLQGKAVIIGAADSKRGVVSTASYEARKFGVHSAMPIQTAKKLCPHGIYLPGDHQAYSSFSRQMFSIFRNYSSRVTPMSIDEGYIDITESLLLFGGEESLALSLKSDIQTNLGFTISVGIASTRIIAKMGASQNKPDGLTIIPEGCEKEFLSPLSIREIPGIGKKSEPAFLSAGIKIIGDLYTYSETTLTKKFGKYGGSLWKTIHGLEEESEYQEGNSIAKSISRETTFEEDVSDWKQLEKEIMYLARDVGYQIRKEKLSARTVTVKVRYGNFLTLTRRKTFSIGIREDVEIFKVACELIKKEFKKPLRLIGVGCSNFEDTTPVSLFETVNPKEEAYTTTLDKIMEKFGKDKVKRGKEL